MPSACVISAAPRIGTGEGLVPSPGPRQWGCAARVSPSSYVTACGCHGHRGIGPGSKIEAWKPPGRVLAFSVLMSTIGGCVADPQNPVSGPLLVQSVKQTQHSKVLERWTGLWSSVPNHVPKGLTFQDSDSEIWDWGLLRFARF